MLQNSVLWFVFVSLIHKLPVIAKGIGKNQFKRYLELFIDSIFYSLVSYLSITFIK